MGNYVPNLCVPEPNPRPALDTGRYKVVNVLRGGELRQWFSMTAPKTEWLLERGQARRALFVIRFWPSRKGWRVIDMRQAVRLAPGGKSYPEWRGHRFLDTVFPTEDAAIMAAIALSAA